MNDEEKARQLEEEFDRKHAEEIDEYFAGTSRPTIMVCVIGMALLIGYGLFKLVF